MTNVLRKPKDIKLLFLTCWITYFFCYLGRLNYSVVIVEIIEINLLSKAQAGLVSMGGFFAYGGGQLLSGALASRLNPKHMMMAGLVVSGLCNLVMSFVSILPVMLVIWTINGLAQALMWVPISKMFAEYLDYKDGVKASTHFSTCSTAATFFTYFFVSLILSLLNWKFVFSITSIIMFAVIVFWYLGISKVEKKLESEDNIPSEGKIEVKEVVHPSIKVLFLSSGLILVLFATFIQGILKDGVSTWIPTLISEKFKIESFAAILISAVLPLINIAGTYVASNLNIKAFKNEATTGAVLFGVITITALCLLIFNQSGIVSTMVLLTVLTASVTGINLLFIGFVPLHFSKWKFSAFISGIANSLTYLGTALSVYGFGAISSKRGWNSVILIWLIISVLAIIVLTIVSKRWKRFTRAANMPEDDE